MKKLLTRLFVTALKPSFAKLFAGVAYATFNNPECAYSFRGTGSTVMVEYVSDDDAAFFINASLYQKSIDSYISAYKIMIAIFKRSISRKN